MPAANQNLPIKMYPKTYISHGYQAKLEAAQRKIEELQHRVDMCNELIREEPEFRIEHEFEKQNLMLRITEQTQILQQFKLQYAVTD